MNDEQQVRDLIAAWLRETKAGNVDAVLALMAPDVVFLVPGQPPMQGRDSFAQALRGVLTAHEIESISDIDEIEVSGDMAYCRTRLSVTVTSRHGKTPVQRTGHTLSILRKDSDGKWRLTRDANLLAGAS